MASAQLAMIQIGSTVIDLGDPMVKLALAGGAVVLVVLILLVMAVRRAGEATRNITPMVQSLQAMQARVETLADGQSALSGGLTRVSEASAASQANMLRLMETRLAEVSKGMAENLANSATKTARSLGELQERLQTIDKAQANIEKLSGDVLSLQDILSNKQTRGAFGEIQLYDMTTDVGEQTNLGEKNPEVVSSLTRLLEKYVADGRSTPGAKQKNDADIDIWKRGGKNTKKK